MKYMIPLLLTISITACNTGDETANEFNLQYHGALKNMMRKGDISAKADLATFENTAHFYALGAIENLKGEIQIFDSQPFNTMVIDDTLAFDNTFSKKATLLVAATVSKWKSFNIPAQVKTYEDLEHYVEQTAKDNQIAVDEPFPFLIEGTASSFDWHVINWKDGDTVHSHEKHIQSGLHGTIENRQVEILGFYSDAHHAIFTHHTTNMHLHVKSADHKMAGHLDDLTLGKEMVLKLPVSN